MANVTIGKVEIRMRGVSRADARRAIANLGPALQRALAGSTAPITSATKLDVKVARGGSALADRIAAPLAKSLRGGSR
ncbi:MAG: hypothetical protein ABI591_34050 [Kofleriaceae bacterium]